LKLLHFCLVVYLVALHLICSESAEAQTRTDRFTARSSSVTPPETGSLSDFDSASWKNALRVSLTETFTTRTIAAEHTDVYILFGPDDLFCAFVNSQTHDPIVAVQRTNNVGLGLDDYDTIMFDTSGNGTNQYFFEASALGTRYQQASESTRYNPSWSAVGQVLSKTEWLVEMRIPYKYLRTTSRSWRVNFARYLATSQQILTWSYEPQMSSPYDETFWPILDGVPAVATRRPPPSAEVYALASLGRDRSVFEGAAGQFVANSARALGADAKVPITPSLNFDATLNPDFSNVENDQQVISPQEFAYQYSEYRPFFTQGASYLPGTEVFYSPRVGIFDHGEKIEGQEGAFGIGVLNVAAFETADRAFNFAYNDPNQELSVALAGSQAFRSAGYDDVLELSGSDTNLRSRISFGGGAAQESGTYFDVGPQAMRDYVFASVARANYSLATAYYDIGPNYHPLDAYVASSDLRGPQVSGSLSSTVSTTSLFRYSSLSGSADRYVDGSGAAHEADTSFSASTEFQNLLTLSVSQGESSLRSYARGNPFYEGGVTSSFNQTTFSSALASGKPDSAYVSYSWGPYSSFFLQQIKSEITHQFTSRLSAEFDYDTVLERSTLDDGQQLTRYSLIDEFNKESSLTVAYRDIHGTGGFAEPGHNLAISFSRRFQRGDTLQVEFGSPAAAQTLDRFIIKYVYLVGAGAGE